MPATCVNGRCTKEGGACLICGCNCPPSLGVKPRKYCSARCSRAAQGRLPKPSSVPCDGCGKKVDQTSRGPVVRFCSPACRGKHAGTLRVCRGCGGEFRFIGKKQFCSDECRWPTRKPVSCKVCGSEFVRTCSDQSCCSKACVGKLTAQRNKARAKSFICLNCGKPYHAKNRSRCSFKFCSRDCSFEARRLKKPCAVRPIDAARGFASWFLDWGNDYWPHAYKCCECGVAILQKKGEEKYGKCIACRDAKPCVDCGAAIQGGFKRCASCRRIEAVAAKKRSKCRRRRLHGGDSHRARCRRVNAPYTPVSRKKILDRDNWTCRLCGVPLLERYTRLPEGGVDSRSPTLDHIVPIARGPDGPGHVESNCQAACWGCNTEKSDLDPDSFAATKATALDSKAWQKAQHQRRSTSSSCEDQRKPTTARSLAPLCLRCQRRQSGCALRRKRCSAWSADTRSGWARSPKAMSR